jgi:hypothetical protein
MGPVSAAGRLFRALIAVTLLATPGCATRYRLAASGREGLVGLGRLDLTKQGASVASGARVPGLCVGWADDHAGVSVGWTIRERIYFQPDAPIELPRVRFGLGWRGAGNSLWGIGWLQMRTPPSRPGPQTIASAAAVAGLDLGLEAGRPGVSLGLRSLQYTQVATNGTAIEIDQPRTGWPGFDLLGARTRLGFNLSPQPSSP